MMFRILRWVALTAVVGFMLVTRWLEDDDQPGDPGLAKRVPATGKPFD